MKSQNKYWFWFFTVLFVIDTLISNSYYLLPNATESEWMNRIVYYCMSKGVTGSLIYFYIANFRNPKPKMDTLDIMLGNLCGIVTIYSAVRILFGALFISDIWYWSLFVPFYLIIAYNKFQK